MQRIDENTYIDDTLVTCAEYQLFIDEMREQGKYYQPDHWTSYQFVDGKAREPILGVRQSDAIAFCGWLIRQENGDWKYRLLSEKEADTYPVTYLRRGLLGYWLSQQFQFEWVGTVPEDARTITRAIYQEDDYDTLGIGQSFIRDPDLDRALARALDCPLDFSYAFKRFLNLILDLNPNLGSDHEFEFETDNDYMSAIDLVRFLDRSLASVLDSTRTRALSDILSGLNNLVYDLARNRDLGRDLSPYITRARDLSQSRELSPRLIGDHDITHARELALDIYVDLFTLQESIAGSSPAFEGIRLVKERIR